ncbi:serine/threonine protein kinase, partial [Streptomyces sp. NPDC058964]
EQLRPDLGDGVRRALMRALEPDRERRWPGAQAFADELDRLAAGTSAVRPRRRFDGIRKRLNTVTLAVAAVLAATAAAVTVTLVNRDSPAGPVRVADATGRISAQVPAGWGRQLRGSGWNPAALGLKSGHQPGLEVADDLSKWPDLNAAVNGVFIGLSERGGVEARVKGLAHSGCHYDGDRAFVGADWHGRIRAWSACPDGGSITETVLAPADGASRPQVYVQVRRHGGGDRTEGILGSLRIT